MIGFLTAVLGFAFVLFIINVPSMWFREIYLLFLSKKLLKWESVTADVKKYHCARSEMRLSDGAKEKIWIYYLKLTCTQADGTVLTCDNYSFKVNDQTHEQLEKIVESQPLEQIDVLKNPEDGMFIPLTNANNMVLNTSLTCRSIRIILLTLANILFLLLPVIISVIGIEELSPVWILPDIIVYGLGFYIFSKTYNAIFYTFGQFRP